MKTYENIRKISTSQGDDYTTGCLLDYTYFKKHYKRIAVYLSKKTSVKRMKILEKSLLAKEMTIRLVVCQTIPISKNITKGLQYI